MLTTEQIRTLNDARTILADARPGQSWGGGVVRTRLDVAENAIFQALNASRAYLGESISDTLMHNREEPSRTRSLGSADSITIEGMEDGYELTISTDDGLYVVNVHSITHDLIKVGDELKAYWAEGRAAAADHQRDLDKVFDGDGIPTDDPKHPDWHSVHADIYDNRSAK